MSGYDGWGDQNFRGRFHADIRDGLWEKGFAPDTGARRRELPALAVRFVRDPAGAKFPVYLVAQRKHGGWLWYATSPRWESVYFDTWQAAYVAAELAEWGKDASGLEDLATTRERMKKLFTG